MPATRHGMDQNGAPDELCHLLVSSQRARTPPTLILGWQEHQPSTPRPVALLPAVSFSIEYDNRLLAIHIQKKPLLSRL